MCLCVYVCCDCGGHNYYVHGCVRVHAYLRVHDVHAGLCVRVCSFSETDLLRAIVRSEV